MENRAAKPHILESNEEDRISKLPEPILHHILCSLSQKEAIKTCVLSKPWRYLGCTRPKIKYVGKDDSVDSPAFMDRILQGCHDRNLCLDEFTLRLSKNYVDPDGVDTASLLKKWIPIIIQHMRVKTFRLSLNLRPHVFELPSLILESDYIQNLFLVRCMLGSTAWVRVDLNRLEKLRLDNVYIPEEILKNILSNCPFLEDVSLDDCYGFTTIKMFINNNKLTKLAHFYFYGNQVRHDVSIEIGDDLQTLTSIDSECKPLEFSHGRPLSLTGVQLLSYSFSCNFTRLFLCEVYIPQRILNSILSDCPFIEDVSLDDCRGFKRIKMLSNKPTNLAHFYFRGHRLSFGVSIKIEDNIQTLRSIEIRDCLFSVSHNKLLECDRLTQLILRRVQLSSELFSCNLHSLEVMSLDRCSGIKEFKLSSRSMKRLFMNNISRPFKATIDAPSIVTFHYEGILPQYISFATTNASDDLWKSKINVGDNYHEPSFQELYGLLKAIRQSEISLEFVQIKISRLWRQLDIGSTNDDIVGSVSEEANHELPVAVEHLRIYRSYYDHVDLSTDPFLNMSFHMFRPSFVYMSTDMLKDSNNENREIAELLFKERETAHSYFWQRDLEEVSLQVLYLKQSEWQPVEYTSFAEVSKKGASADEILDLRIQLKWREKNEPR